MKTFFLICICLFLSISKSRAQENKSCYEMHNEYLFCKSKKECRNGKDSAYHQELIFHYLQLINRFEKQVKGNSYNQLGLLYYHFNNLYSAMYYYQKAYIFKDFDGAFANNIGTIYFKQGKFINAYAYFKKAYLVDSSNQDYLNNLAAYFGTVGNYKTSIKWSKKSMAINTDNDARLLAIKTLVITYGFLKNKSKVKYYQKMYDEATFDEGTTNLKEPDCDCQLPICDH
jgi:tetratricopeptide (TPR) repeat protein